VYTDSYYSEAGLALLFSKAHDNQLAGGDLDGQRLVFGKIINRIVRFLDEDLFSTAPTWLDAGCGNGALVFTAAEHGFSAFGLDVREEAVQRIRQLGYEAYTGDLMQLSLKYPLSVLSLADVLEHLPYPIAALRKAHDLLKPGGVLFVSCPNMECSSWRAMDAMQANPYWHELEHYHNFSRTRLCQILTRCGFQPVDYAPSERYKACMEVIALRPAKSGGFAARQPTTAHHEAVAPSS
jgi:SAM-dependent methyltransferase